MKLKKIYHINDRTMKYKSLILNKYQHQYLKLPGTYESRYPQEIVFPNMSAGRADEFYSTKEGLMINLEEESEDISKDILKKISNYVIFADFMYSKRVYSAIICHKDPGKPFEYYERSPSIIIKVYYIYFSQKELWDKYENLIKKIKQKEELSIDESLDMVFVPKFISKEKGQDVTESIVKAFKYAKINEKIPRRDIAVILGAIVLKHFDNEKTINELLEELNMKQIGDEIKILAREEFKEEYEKLEQETAKIKQETDEIEQENIKIKQETAQLKQETAQLKQETAQIKEGLEQLSKMKDLNSPQARQLLDSLLEI